MTGDARVVALACPGADTGADVRLSMGGEPVLLQIDYPSRAVPLSDMLPILHGLASAVTEAASRGREVSCRAGCGACCRQAVPVSPSEAVALARLVEALPEPKRGEVKARFAEAVRRLEAAGLGPLLRASGRPGGPTGRALGVAYFAAGIACPFLVEESCSIHADRPTACREYLVTSPAAECARPTEEAVHVVPIPVSVAGAARAMEGSAMPLVLALEYAAGAAEESRPGAEWLRAFLKAWANADV